MKRHHKIELLAPAGSFEKLKITIHYGAEAVYLTGKDFSLRNCSGNFALPELDMAIRFVHDFWGSCCRQHLPQKSWTGCHIRLRGYLDRKFVFSQTKIYGFWYGEARQDSGNTNGLCADGSDCGIGVLSAGKPRKCNAIYAGDVWVCQGRLNCSIQIVFQQNYPL